MSGSSKYPVARLCYCKNVAPKACDISKMYIFNEAVNATVELLYNYLKNTLKTLENAFSGKKHYIFLKNDGLLLKPGLLLNPPKC